MGSTREEQDRVRSLLLDTVTLLCKNGLNFKKQLKVQGLLGITLDEDDVFIVHINEKVGELIVEHHKKDDSDESSIDSTPAKVHRKRRSDSSPMYRGPPDKIRIKTEKEEPSEDDLILIDENQCDDKSKIQKTIIQQQQPGLHSITNFQGGYQPFNQQNNMQTGPGYMTSSNILPHQNMPQTGQPTPEKLFVPSWFAASSFVNDSKPKRRRDSSQNDEKQFTCEFPGCGRKYFNKRHMLRHQTSMHGRPKVRGNMYAKNISMSSHSGSSNISGKESIDFSISNNIMELKMYNLVNDNTSSFDHSDDSSVSNKGAHTSEYSNTGNSEISLLTYSSGYKCLEDDSVVSDVVDTNKSTEETHEVNEIKLEPIEEEQSNGIIIDVSSNNLFPPNLKDENE